jgi:hypothetical protein
LLRATINTYAFGWTTPVGPLHCTSQALGAELYNGSYTSIRDVASAPIPDIRRTAWLPLEHRPLQATLQAPESRRLARKS